MIVSISNRPKFILYLKKETNVDAEIGHLFHRIRNKSTYSGLFFHDWKYKLGFLQNISLDLRVNFKNEINVNFCDKIVSVFVS